MSGTLFVVSAPSGTGKTTLVNALLNDWSNTHPLKRVVTYTTRAPRQDEVEGKDYHFVSCEDFQKKIQEEFFLEWVLFCDNYYGSPAYVLNKAYREDCSYIMVIDHAGGVKIKGLPGVVLIWIMPPTLNTLRDRLLKRGKDSAEIIEQRIEKAQQELESEEHEKAYPYHLVNDAFSDTLIELKRLLDREMRELKEGAK